jgi:hypothetical protein
VTLTSAGNARGRRRACVLLLAAAGSVYISRTATAQEAVGHAVPGTIGLKAGSQASTGLYFIDRVLNYRADQLIDRQGRSLPERLDLAIFSNVFGAAFAYEIAPLRTYVGASVSAPLSHVTEDLQIPEASVDQFGLGDLYVQPLKLGWRTEVGDIVASYAFYAPTAPHEPGGTDGVGKGQWTHEVSLGGTLYFDRERTWSLSTLASLELPQRKLDVDVKRGSYIQIQGGFGKTLRKFFDVGLAGYALWQLTEDEGGQLPVRLRGQSDQAFGLGPEMGVTIAPIRTRVTVRYEHDLAVRSRPEGQVLVLQLVFTLWRPAPGR